MMPVLGMPMIMASGAKPFSLSGSWESDFEEWSASVGYSRSNTVFRTGSWSLNIGGTNSGPTVRNVPDAGGCTVTASVWHRNNGVGADTRTLSYRINGGSIVLLQSSNLDNTTWARLSGTFTVPPGATLEIWISKSTTNVGVAQIYFDDWEITGVPT
jgi:hypothetical protein